MTSQELSRLIDAHLEDRLTSAEAEALSKMLVHDVGARRQFWEQAAVHGLLPEAAQLEWLGQAVPEPERNVVRVNWWRRIAPFAAAATVAVLALVWWNRSPGERVKDGIAVLSRTVGAQLADAAEERTTGAVL